MLTAKEMKQKFDEDSDKLFKTLFSNIEQKFLSTRKQSINLSIKKSEITNNDIEIIKSKLKELGYKCQFNDEFNYDYNGQYSTGYWKVTVWF